MPCSINCYQIMPVFPSNLKLRVGMIVIVATMVSFSNRRMRDRGYNISMTRNNMESY